MVWGDAYNDTSNAQYTVSGTGQTITTVVAQVAALYGAPKLESRAISTYTTTQDLVDQANGLGILSATADLVVITAGTEELKAGVSGATFLGDLKRALDIIKAKGAKHIVIMEVVDTTTAPNADAATLAFNTAVKGDLGSYADVARYGNISRPSAAFPGWATNTNTPYCGLGSIGGCAVGANNPDLYFLADSVYPTPAGNRWLGLQLYTGTGGGWR